MSGVFGLGTCNDAGRDLVNWCEENGLAYVNSFMSHRRRGTWFNRIYGRWYELDGFIVRRRDRHRLVRRMNVVNEVTLSDHKPKRMVIRVGGKRWRQRGNIRTRVPRIRWEKLREEGKKEEYREVTDRLYRETGWGGEEDGQTGHTEWDRMTGIMICLLYTSPSPRDKRQSRMPSSA